MADLNKTLTRRRIEPHPDPRESRRVWAAFRGEHGAAPIPAPLLTPPGNNWKIKKNSLPTFSLSLAPANTAGPNCCPFSTPECRRHCVAHAGRGTFQGVAAGRARRTLFLQQHPEHFLAILADEIERAQRRHGRIAVRLNTFSDIRYEDVAPFLFRLARVTFYDYTKHPAGTRAVPHTYHLTQSATERTTADDLEELLNTGHTVAVVSADKITRWRGYRVIDGDADDARYRDKPGTLVRLAPKGTMKKARSRFVFDLAGTA